MATKERFRISAKDLGAIAQPDFCERCFWLQRLVPKGLPFQIFPGIFSSIDAYTKHVVHGWFDRQGRAPDWLTCHLPGVVSYQPPPHYSKFFIVDEPSGMKLTGSPDALFEKADQSLLIADYKTAKYTATQDKLLPMYETQLNAYAYIASEKKMKTVSGLALIYAEPVTSEEAAGMDGVHHSDGFRMSFCVRVMDVNIHLRRIPELLQRARGILDRSSAPPRQSNCGNCDKLAGLLSLVEAS